MRQVWITKRGGFEVLQLKEAPDPEPKAGEVRIRVTASGINFADLMARMGLYPDAPPLPCVVGYEVAGTVDGLGPGVSAPAKGARVLALTRFGGYSDVVVVPASQAAPIPPGLSFEQAAAIPVTYLTAWVMLIRLGNLQRGEKLLVHAAAGGVGQAALQIAKWRGAEVIGTASKSKHARLREAGVAHCIDYTREDFETEAMRLTSGKGVDMIIDAVGGKSFAKSYRCLASLGKLFLFGASSFATGEKRSIIAALRGLAAMPRFKPLTLMNDNRGVFGVNLGHLFGRAAELGAMLGEILELCGKGVLTPIVDRSFPAEQAGEAHRFMQERKNFGKVLLSW